MEALPFISIQQQPLAELPVSESEGAVEMASSSDREDECGEL